MSLLVPEGVLNTLKGKRVALIGPSPHLLGLKKGPMIDQCDIVCRVNDIVPSNYAEDYGNKNDIIFHACPTLWIDNFANKLARDVETTKKIKYVICPKIKAIHDGSGSVVDNFNNINKYDIPFWWIGESNYHYLHSQVGCEPNTGIMAIQILLACGVKELFLSGFSFYQQYTNNQKYGECYYNNEEYSPHTQRKNTSPFSGHNQTLQANYFKNLMFNYQKIVMVDSFINQMLDIQHPNVLELE